MTEAEWLSCGDPTPMLEFLRDKASDRKLRLFACACCRLIWASLVDVRSRAAVEVAERLADALTTDDEVAIADEDAKAAARVGASFAPVYLLSASLWAGGNLPSHGAAIVALASVETFQRSVTNNRREAIETAITQKQVLLFGEIFGSPFYPVALDPSWLTSTVVALAEGIYQERAFDRMVILADALQDAGCDNEDVLNHCQQPGEHVKGCWVVDLILGKS